MSGEIAVSDTHTIKIQHLAVWQLKLAGIKTQKMGSEQKNWSAILILPKTGLLARIRGN